MADFHATQTTSRHMNPVRQSGVYDYQIFTANLIKWEGFLPAINNTLSLLLYGQWCGRTKEREVWGEKEGDTFGFHLGS